MDQAFTVAAAAVEEDYCIGASSRRRITGGGEQREVRWATEGMEGPGLGVGDSGMGGVGGSEVAWDVDIIEEISECHTSVTAGWI